MINIYENHRLAELFFFALSQCACNDKRVCQKILDPRSTASNMNILYAKVSMKPHHKGLNLTLLSFRCMDGVSCVDLSTFCDGITDCADASDEAVCSRLRDAFEEAKPRLRRQGTSGMFDREQFLLTALFR
jgi:hypothetical protein